MKTITSTFSALLEDALKHYPDTTWLGENSPLAAAYFLGRYLPRGSELAGRGLQKLLADATDAITGKNALRYQTILREYYFQDRPAAVVWDQIGLTKNSFHLSRKAAIGALEEQVIGLLQPALRLEQPPLSAPLVERAEPLARCRTQLAAAQSVAILGPSGIGKTILAAQLAQEQNGPVFWYTLRPTLNDQVESLIFALALFAHRHGVSTLWLELVTNPRQPIDERSLSALRYVLTQIQPAPLLCIDGLEHLQPTTLVAHQAFVACLESLRGLVPILLLGQQVPIEADDYITLGNLSAAGVSQWLGQEPLAIPSSLRADFHALTLGNPRLLKLALAALAAGATADSLQETLLTSPTIELLFARTTQQLSESARQLLMALSVFRNGVPNHLWRTPTSQALLAQLIGLGLVQTDGVGSIELPAVYRAQLYSALSAETRQQLHLQAAAICNSTGNHTAAMHHLIRAEQVEDALVLWRERQVQEIAQGQAITALKLFYTLQQMALAPAAREQTLLFCAQLEQLTGQNERAQATLSAALIRTPILAIEAQEVLGMVANERSDFEHADDAFQRGLRMAEQLVEVKMARLHKGRGWMHLRQREINEAERALGLAQYEIENMRGNLALDRANYADAQAYYQVAFGLAQALGHLEAQGKTLNNIGSVALFQGNFDQAIEMIQGALVAYQTIGKMNAVAGCHITEAVAHNQAGSHDAALDAIQTAETLLNERGEVTPWQEALMAQARAEAYLGKGNLAHAEAAVKVAIAAEEISLLPDAYRVYGEICGAQGHLAEGENFIRNALTLAQKNQDLLLTAYAWRSLGQIHQQQGKANEMATALAEATQIFEELNLPYEIARTRALTAGEPLI